MRINIAGHHVSMGQALQDYAKTKLQNTVEKYFKNAVDSKIIFEKVGHAFKAEILVHEASKEYAFGDAEANDIYVAFDTALHRIEKQLSKEKEKSKSHNHRSHDEEF